MNPDPIETRDQRHARLARQARRREEREEYERRLALREARQREVEAELGWSDAPRRALPHRRRRDHLRADERASTVPSFHGWAS